MAIDSSRTTPLFLIHFDTCEPPSSHDPAITMQSYQDALAQKYWVIALELPGFGTSPANSRSQSVQELANTTAQACAQAVPDNHTLIATSFGANVALWQTLQAPDKSDCSITISTRHICAR